MARYHNTTSYLEYLSFPLHLCFFSVVLFLILGFSWYMSYESVFGDFLDQLKLVLMVSPLLLLGLVLWLSKLDPQRVPFGIPLPEISDNRAGGSPWGVALLLVILMFMISYQSYFHERWFPLLTR